MFSVLPFWNRIIRPNKLVNIHRNSIIVITVLLNIYYCLCVCENSVRLLAISTVPNPVLFTNFTHMKGDWWISRRTNVHLFIYRFLFRIFFSRSSGSFLRAGGILLYTSFWICFFSFHSEWSTTGDFIWCSREFARF